ncbi:glycosyltransferase [Streptomyces sp. PTM05]|uniref:Glycosyltransferase n=1 Tax=Streptantibioticus parmotrematis TaxID=2873249 RepID=A0ABS7QZC7_9ACTN|nr:glycosyltransferase [Streptantibioticus parmotrematis]MBY8888288.1 glycosyltransferase [Streptantibioticus parmotrematis]
MTGPGRRAPAACPGLAARDSLYTPAHVVDVDLEAPGEPRSPGGARTDAPGGRVLALVRLHGHPLGLVSVDGDFTDTVRLGLALADAAHRHLAAPLAPRVVRRAAPPRLHGTAGAPAVSVVVATHDRPWMLRRCLDSLLRCDHPSYEVIVVDNAPADDATRQLVEDRYRDRVRYLTEPVPGLGRAHNRGLAVARGRICAFTDDDTLADPGWLSALQDAFDDPAHREGNGGGPGCVTGLILPAELETPAQSALERHGGFGKGFTPRAWSLRDPPPDPLFPFTAGRFGSGANMAFRTDVLRSLGGFDPATGTGTPARGGDDLLAFFQVIRAGHRVVYQPDAVIWHRHRRTDDALAAQAFGYGAGFGAFLAAAVRHRPGTLPALLRRLPRGVAHAAARARARAAADGPLPGPADAAVLTRLELRGLLYGPFGYLRSVLAARRADRLPRSPDPVGA